MSREDKKLQKHFDERARRELRKAAKARVRENPAKTPRQRFDLRWTDDEDFEFENPVPSKKQIHNDGPSASATAGLVVEIGVGFCDVLSAGQRVRCRSTMDCAIGDNVLFSTERRRIEQVLSRRTTLSRTDPHNPHIERVIAANVDVVVNVVSVKSPPLRPGLIDRYLIATGRSGAVPLLCVNKIDLLASAEELDPLKPYQELGVDVCLCSAATGEGLDQLAQALAGRLCVFAGHSGVGKSSLLNALDPTLELTTGLVSHGNERGTHTTTSSALYRLPNGAVVIDTPGIREFGLWAVSEADVRRYYAEFGRYTCAFADCIHIHEPHCGVKEAVATGGIAQTRYEGYIRILHSLSQV